MTHVRQRSDIYGNQSWTEYVSYVDFGEGIVGTTTGIYLWSDVAARAVVFAGVTGRNCFHVDLVFGAYRPFAIRDGSAIEYAFVADTGGYLVVLGYYYTVQSSRFTNCCS